VDLNRDIIEGAQGDLEAEEIWGLWNGVLQDYTDTVSLKFNRGLYVDIHSHDMSDAFQLGYGITTEDYWKIKDGERISKHSTMYPLKLRDRTEYDSLFGNGSFEHLLSIYGFKVAIPVSDKTYLNGGRNIKKFSGRNIGALQIECPISELSFNLDRVAKVLAYCINSYKNRFAGDFQ
jgi:hypothetical protein